MVLSTQEESLINVVRNLPREEATKVLNLAHQLTDLARGREVEWSDSWTEEDLAEANRLRLYDVRRSGAWEPLKPGDVVVAAFPGAR